MKKVRMWVSSNWKRKCKIEAATKGLPVIEYTELLANGLKQVDTRIKPKRNRNTNDFFKI